MQRRGGDRPGYADLAAQGGQLAGQGEQGGGLAGTVGPKECHHLTGVNDQVHVVDNCLFALTGR